METKHSESDHNNKPQRSESSIEPNSQHEIKVGDIFRYGLFGRCRLLGTETKVLSGNTVAFYKLEPVKSSFSRSTRQEPSILLPVKTAIEHGLRGNMTTEQAEQIFLVLASRDYYFDINEPWHTVFSKLDYCARKEGAIGLAKALSYLHILRSRQIVTQKELSRIYDLLKKQLLNETSETLKMAPAEIEIKIDKALRSKLLSNH